METNLNCPVIIEKKKEELDFEDKLVNTVENWFSDEEIHKHKDILVSMNSYGWVPLTVIESKLEEMIIIGSKDLSKKLQNSSLLKTDISERYIRRVNTTLPVMVEHRQMVLLDIPDLIKSVRQMPGYLQIDGSTVDYFDYSIHSAIITLVTREEAVKVVTNVQESGRMQAKLLVPTIVKDSSEDSLDAIATSAGQVDVQKILASLALKNEPVDRVHVIRLAPQDLSHSFGAGFQPPSPNQVEAIVKQCNFYFSDANVLKDLFILKKIKSNPGGWIELAVVARFKQLVKLSGDCLDNVVYAMCFSDQVQISRDAKSLRRRLPLPEWDSSIYTRSLFLWNMPRLCDSYDKLDQVFQDEGRFNVRVSRFIHADRNVPPDLRKLSDKIQALGNIHCGVVEFETRGAMMSADEFIHMKWTGVKTFYLDTKEDLPKPAIIVGKTSRNLPPPIPISTFNDDRVAPFQVGTRIDPRFWQVARLLSAKKRSEMKIYVNETDSKHKSPLPCSRSPLFNLNNKSEFPDLVQPDHDKTKSGKHRNSFHQTNGVRNKARNNRLWKPNSKSVTSNTENKAPE